MPLEVLKSSLETLKDGVTLATLSLQKLSEAHLYPPSMSMSEFAARPTFPLASFAADADHAFPQLGGFGVEASPSDAYTWVLDFTAGGKRPGVVMSQSRMKAVELVANPLHGGEGLSNVGDVLSFGSGSWVDHLVCALCSVTYLRLEPPIVESKQRSIPGAIYRTLRNATVF